ncbi:MAG: hypothetical protein DMF86_17580 [Acidobacteria bacterium]|nr:MAG: hypothetical protein DMF86_17580 [Acidobacteriota bacterium]
MTREADRLAAAAAAAALLLFIPLLIPALTGRVFSQGDLTDFYVPMRYVYARALAAGDTVMWSPALFGGFYAHGEGQLGMFHPFHLLVYQLLPLAAAFNLQIVATYVAAFGGLFLLLRRGGLSAGASIFGSMAFTFSGFNLMHLLHVNMVAVGAHIPWMLLAADVVLTARTAASAAGGFVLLAGTLASALLLGFPQFVWMGALVTGAYTLARGIALRAWDRVAWVAAAAVCGVAIGAAQLLPTLDMAADSSRRITSPGFALSYSLHPLNTVELWCPYVFPKRFYAPPGETFAHELTVYDGAFCVIALAWVAARWRTLEHRRVALGAAALCAAGFVLALGRYGGVYTVLRQLPLLTYFRAPARHILLIHLGLAVLAAVALDDIDALARRPDGGVSRARRAVFAIVALSAVTAAVAIGFAGITVGLIASVALIAGTALLVLLASHGRRWALLCLPFCLALDLGAWGYRYVWYPAPMTVEQMAALVVVPAAARPGERLFISEYDALANVVVLRGYQRLAGYVGLPPRKWLRPDTPIVQRVAGVTWAVRNGMWTPVDAPMPRVRVVRDARVTANPRRDIQQIDIARTALVANDVGALQGDDASAAVTVDRPGRLEVDVGGTGRRLLVTTESYHAGWRAAEGQRTLATARVNGDFLGVIVEDGVKHVALVFDPWSARMGLRVSGVGIALTLIGALVLSFREQRPSRQV